MARIEVVAGRTLLETYIKTPPIGLCELIWNAFDEDATTVSVNVGRNMAGGVERILVEDNGNGMTEQRAVKAFSTVGDSWKLVAGTKSDGGRLVHGKFGRGRYSAFALGDSVRWTSTSRSIEGSPLKAIEVRGTRTNLNGFEVEEIELADRTKGTAVDIRLVDPETSRAFDEAAALRERLVTEFALHVDRYPDFQLEFLGVDVDPAAVIASKQRLQLKDLDGVDGDAFLNVIEWTISNVDRRLYLCTSQGTIVDEMPPGVQAVGAEFTAYVEWDGFVHDQGLLLDGDTRSEAGRVVAAAKDAIKTILAESARRREAKTINRWRSEGVYPYKGQPKSVVERAARDTFNVVAMAAARTVDEAKSQSSKALALTLLRETFESNPEALLPIMRQFSKLPASRIDELREILERTTLSQLIALGKEVGNRIEFLDGLNGLLFDSSTKKRVLERRQLHRILAHETWLFGEEWSLTGDDERLKEVLKKFLRLVGEDVDLASDDPIAVVGGTDAIPDLVFGRQLETSENQFAHLVVELKRPSHKLTDEDITQLRKYASSITGDERFDQPNCSWEFWLIGNEVRAEVEELRTQPSYPYGVVQKSKKYTMIVKTWAEIIGDAQHRLKFVQRSLQYESGRDIGLAALRDRYAEFIPEEPSSEPEGDSAAS